MQSLIAPRASVAHVELSDLLKLRVTASRLPLFGQNKQAYQAGMGYHSQLRGRGIEFSEVRAYQPGDDVRHMDWRVMAKTGKPYTKLYEEERGRPVLLVTDQRSSMHFATQGVFKSVLASEIAALMGWSALSHGDRVGGVVVGDISDQVMRPNVAQKSFLPFLKALSNSEHSHEPSRDLTETMQHVRKMATSGYLVVVISDFYGLSSDAEAMMAQLARQHTVVLCWIYDPLEKAPPPPGCYPVTNGQEVLSFDSSQVFFQEQYKAWFDAREQQLKRIERRHGTTLWRFQTDDVLLPRLYRYLRERRS